MNIDIQYIVVLVIAGVVDINDTLGCVVEDTL